MNKFYFSLLFSFLLLYHIFNKNHFWFQANVFSILCNPSHRTMLEQRQINLRKYLRSQGVLNSKVNSSKKSKSRPREQRSDQIIDEVVNNALVSISEEQSSSVNNNHQTQRQRLRGTQRARGANGRGTCPTYR